MHVIGRLYPNAVGYNNATIEQDEQMPVEECANMIIMTYAYHKFTNDTSYLPFHFPILQQWAEYLTKYSIFPNETEMSTGRSFNLALHGTRLTRQ